MGLGTQLNDVKYWYQKPSSYMTFSNTSKLVKSGEGTIEGIYVASGGGSSTFKLWDNTIAATTVLINTTTCTTGFLPLRNIKFSNGLFLTLTTTAELTVFYK